MSKYRHDLPQLKGGMFLADGGMETTLIFHEGAELPHFAAFVLLADRAGRQQLKDYYIRYLDIAARGKKRLRSGYGDVAGQSGLGRQARLQRGSTQGSQRGCRRTPQRNSRRV